MRHHPGQVSANIVKLKCALAKAPKQDLHTFIHTPAVSLTHMCTQRITYAYFLTYAHLHHTLTYPRPYYFETDTHKYSHSLTHVSILFFLTSSFLSYAPAPEVIRGESHSKASDVYSFGIIIWEARNHHPHFLQVISESAHITMCLDCCFFFSFETNKQTKNR